MTGGAASMTFEDAQSEMRDVYLSGSVGQIVSGAVWLVSAALATWASRDAGMLALVFGGMFIFPMTQAALVATGRRASLGASNPMRPLAMQVAFFVPLCIPVAIAASRHRPGWFYPAFMIVVGAHYLPFVTLYGLRRYALLAAALLAGGMALGWARADGFSEGGWFTAAVLLLFGGHLASRRDRPRASPA